MGQSRLSGRILAWVFASALWATAAFSAPSIDVQVSSENEEIVENVNAASLLLAAVSAGETASQDLVAAALADYRRIVETLYAFGHYSGVVSIRLNGREAASISLLALPDTISTIAIAVDPGPAFRFGKTKITPLAPGTELPEGFTPGQPAMAKLIASALDAAIIGWREEGHAKAERGDQRVVANHPQQTLDAELQVVPGPKVTFGELTITGESAVRRSTIRRIADNPKGEQYSPEAVSDITKRLRRNEAFSSVSITEGPVNSDGTMDLNLAVVDRKPRRFGAGGELSSLEGLDLTGFWMHRNLFGGAERLRIEGEIAQIGATDNGIDYTLGARLDFPSVVRSDTNLFVGAKYESLDDPQFTSDLFEIGAGVTWFARDGLEAEIALAYHTSETNDALGDRDFEFLFLPATITWDRRDEPLDATRGTYLKVEATPYAGLSGSSSGTRLYGDARAYQAFGTGRFVLAGRLQLGSILSSPLEDTYPDFLFYSGGGGSVRGQPYQSLGIDLGGGDTIGGRSYLGTMMELRAKFTDTIGGVLFADAGYVGSDSFGGDTSDWHAGAGVGFRYATPIGPIRVDVAAPVEGDTGDGVQFYIGIGQAF